MIFCEKSVDKTQVIIYNNRRREEIEILQKKGIENMYRPTYTTIINNKKFRRYRNRIEIIEIVKKDKYFTTVKFYCDDEQMLDELMGEEE